MPVGHNGGVQRVEVVEVLDALDMAEVRHWIAGGWGVDALVGSQTRHHRDLDLTVDAEDFDDCMAVLASLGYTVETDWLPLRVEVAAPGGRWVDLHPVRFDAQGRGVQGDREGVHFLYPPSAFTLGKIDARTVHCLSVSQQRLFHDGYELRPHDEHDLQRLAELVADR